jgi:hypothetical protein
MKLRTCVDDVVDDASQHCKGAGMTNRAVETSPQVYARIGGVLYLIIIVIGFCGEFFVRDKLVVSGDVTATANNIMASESLWRGQIAGDLILLVCAVALTLILYILLRPVNKRPCFACGVFQYSRIPYRGRQQAMSFCGIVPFGERRLPEGI